MGDRANIFVVDQKPDSTGSVTGIYLYTHWDGYRWPERLREALSTGPARGRWGDDQYLTRIVVDQLFKDIRDEETGGGISTLRGDNSYPITILDHVNQQIAWALEGGEGNTANWYWRISFEQFVNQEAADYPPASTVIDAEVVHELEG